VESALARLDRSLGIGQELTQPRREA
jgi:hypothetical protein